MNAEEKETEVRELTNEEKLDFLTKYDGHHVDAELTYGSMKATCFGQLCRFSKGGWWVADHGGNTMKFQPSDISNVDIDESSYSITIYLGDK
jgi:hypothetical protein